MATNAHTRKKEPDAVRRRLLDCAARLAVEQGLASVSVQAVAQAAGVTKGGLFHHFASKQALVVAVCDDLLDQLDREIEDYLAKDPQTGGRFSRAYVRAMFADRARGSQSPWAALTMSMIADPHCSQAWDLWLKTRLQAHAETDGGTLLEVVRLAADGAWLAHVIAPGDQAGGNDAALMAQLLAMTQ
jgi:AcrR family transcriptional regulator